MADGTTVEVINTDAEGRLILADALALARREFRRIVLEKLRALTATDDEYRREARALLGVDPQ